MITFFLIYGFFCMLLLAAAAFDFLKLKIPNKIVLALILSFFLFYGFDVYLSSNKIFYPLIDHVSCALIALAITFLLYIFRVFGGGDAKLIPAVALWVGLPNAITFIIVMTVTGFILAIVGLVLKKTKVGRHTSNVISSKTPLSSAWLKALANNKNVLPYGVAIASGGIYSFYFII